MSKVAPTFCKQFDRIKRTVSNKLYEFHLLSDVRRKSDSGSVSVVVLNWNGKRWLKRCLESIRNQTYQPTEVILVDNGSTDGSAEFVNKKFPWVTVVQTEQNLGSAGGHNVGVKESNGDFIAILDNDIYLDKNWLLEMVRAVSLPGVGISGGIVKSYEAPHKPIFFPNRFFPSVRFPWAILTYHVTSDKIVDSGMVQSAAMMVRREVFASVGLLDEGFFFWNEDIDLCVRVMRAGYKVVFNPRAIAYHKVGGLGGRAQKISVWMKTNIRYARKNYALWQFQFAMLFVILANVLFMCTKKTSD